MVTSFLKADKVLAQKTVIFSRKLHSLSDIIGIGQVSVISVIYYKLYQLYQRQWPCG